MTYWHYTYIDFQKSNGRYSCGYGIGNFESDKFEYSTFYKENPNSILLSVNRISKEEYDELYKLIQKRKENEKTKEE